MPGNLLEHFNKFRIYYEKMFAPFGEKYNLTQLDMDILMTLKNHPEWDTARDICAMRCIAKSNASNSLRGLERRKLVNIRIDTENKKIHRLSITELGNELAEELLAIQKNCLREMRGNLTDEDVQHFYYIIKTLDANITKLL